MASVSEDLEHLIPTRKFKWKSSRKPLHRVVLVACGSFSPITNMHLRIFENAKDHLEHTLGKFQVIGGLLSPVHDNYKKANLIASKHRVEMCVQAVASSDWIDVSTWEVSRSNWCRTVDVLTTYENEINRRYNTEKDDPIRVKLLCGSDLLEALLDVKIWPVENVSKILEHFGVVALQREGHNADVIVHESDLLYGYRHNIHIVPQWIANNISSTVVRLNLRRDLSVRYLVPDGVLEYINKHGLYRSKL